MLENFGGCLHDASREARMNSETRERVMTIIAQMQYIPVESVTIDKTFEELNIDSLGAVNILYVVETEFEIAVPDDQVDSLRSIRDLVDGVEVLLAAKAAL
jgi:acyl carrier protein